MAMGFVLGARGSKDGKLSTADWERAANELIETGTVKERGVQLWVRVHDGLIVTGRPEDQGGWWVDVAQEGEKTPASPLVLP